MEQIKSGGITYEQKWFFTENIIFEYPGEEIDKLDDFPGKEDFLEFYTAHNGGSFIYGARFYPKEYYHVFESPDEYIVLEFFLKSL